MSDKDCQGGALRPLRWFGNRYPAMVYEDAEKTPPPVGAVCYWCEEMIAPDDDGFITCDGGILHRACFVRGIIGSIAHVEKRCSCYVSDGPTDGDPPELTKREAAELALATFERRRETAPQAYVALFEGDVIRLRVTGMSEWTVGVVKLASDADAAVQSFFVQVAGPLKTPSGATYFGIVPLMADLVGGECHDLFGNEYEIERKGDPPCTTR